MPVAGSHAGEKKHRLNRKLRKSIHLSKEAKGYTRILTCNNWHGFCDWLSGILGTAKTRSILRALVHPTNSKSQYFSYLRTLSHAYHDDLQWLGSWRGRFISTCAPPTYPDYLIPRKQMSYYRQTSPRGVCLLSPGSLSPQLLAREISDTIEDPP